MSDRLLFVVWGLALLAPLVLVHLLLELTRAAWWAALALLALALLTVAGAQTPFGTVLLSWLDRTPHRLALIAGLVLSGCVGLLLHDLARRRQLRRLQWRCEPPQSEFGEHVIRHLERRGWMRQTLLWTLPMTVCRMEKAPRRITLILVAGRTHPERLSAHLQSIRWKPYGRVVLVPWHPLTPPLLEVATRLGWRVASTRALDAMDSVYDRLPDRPVETVAAPQATAWTELHRTL